MRVFLAWKRRYADVRAGTQASPLRILLERVARGCPPLRFSFGWITRGQITRGTVDVVWEGDMAVHYLFLF